jgi:pyruvate/2-oxoglutarate dehydrogenase complex dihydrolipoamide acyltransferase (E2) component
VKELREENKGWRLKAQEMEQAAQAAKQAAEAAKAESERKLAEASSAAQQRVIIAEMKAAAIKAGMIDLDGLKLLDLSGLKISDSGEVEGADELLAAAKKAKPWLFGDAKTSNPAPAPAPKPAENKKAGEMTDAEYHAARERIRRGLSPL